MSVTSGRFLIPRAVQRREREGQRIERITRVSGRRCDRLNGGAPGWFARAPGRFCGEPGPAGDQIGIELCQSVAPVAVRSNRIRRRLALTERDAPGGEPIDVHEFVGRDEQAAAGESAGESAARVFCVNSDHRLLVTFGDMNIPRSI